MADNDMEGMYYHLSTVSREARPTPYKVSLVLLALWDDCKRFHDDHLGC